MPLSATLVKKNNLSSEDSQIEAGKNIQVPKLEEHKQVEEALLLVNRDKSFNGDDPNNGGIFKPKSPSA